MRRREFIGGLSGAAIALPLAVRAQPSERIRRIGVLMNLASDDAEGQARLAAFHQGLQQLGGAVGRNVQIDSPSRSRQATRRVALCTSIISHGKRLSVSITITAHAPPKIATNKRSPCDSARPQPPPASKKRPKRSRRPGSIRGFISDVLSMAPTRRAWERDGPGLAICTRLIGRRR